MEEVLNKNKLERSTESLSLLHVVIDGKTIKGSTHNDTPAVHLPSAFIVELKSH